MGDVGEVGAPIVEPGRKLEQDGAELSCPLERLQGKGEAPPHLIGQFGREIGVIESLLLGQRPECFADVLRQHLGRRLVLGEEAERLDVEDEGRRGTLYPQIGHLRSRQGVVGTVDLDQGKVRGVVAKPPFGSAGALRIEQPGIDQGLVRPGGGADEDVTHTLRTGSCFRTSQCYCLEGRNVTEEEILVYLVGLGAACTILGLPAVIHAVRLMRQERA